MHNGGGYMDRWEENITFMGANLLREAEANTWRLCGYYNGVLILSFLE